MPGSDRSKNTTPAVFLEPRCEVEAIVKISKPETAAPPPKETPFPQKPVSMYLCWPEGDRIVLLDGTCLYLPSASTPASIGTDVGRGDAVTIGDKERCGGVYVLGQPRTGKSDLLVSLALGDITRGHGILFIDPVPLCHLRNMLLARWIRWRFYPGC